MLAHVLLAFLFLQLPQNDTIPQGVGCHITLHRQLLRDLSFYCHHSGFYNDSKDPLQSEIRITKGHRLLEMTIALIRGQIILAEDILGHEAKKINMGSRIY